MRSTRIAKTALALAIAAAAFTSARADEPEKKGDGKDQMVCCPMDPKAATALEKMKALAGTWTGVGTDDHPAMTVNFRPTSGGTAVIETMFPGSDHEMVNLFTADGDTILLTHYCAMGNQPRMKLSQGDGKSMKFDFVDGGNIKTRNDAHMDSVAFTVEGDKLTEDWSYYSDGKVVDHKVFELHRAK